MESKQNETKLGRSIPFTFLIVIQKTLSLFLSIQSLSNFFPDVHRQTSRVTSFRSLSSSLVIKHGESRTRVDLIDLIVFLFFLFFFVKDLHKFSSTTSRHFIAFSNGPTSINTGVNRFHPIPFRSKRSITGPSHASQINDKIRPRELFIPKIGDDLSATELSTPSCVAAVIVLLSSREDTPNLERALRPTIKL